MDFAPYETRDIHVDILSDPLAGVFQPFIDPIAGESGPGDKVSLNVPMGFPFFDMFDARNDPQPRSRFRFRAAHFERKRRTTRMGRGPPWAHPKPIHTIGPRRPEYCRIVPKFAAHRPGNLGHERGRALPNVGGCWPNPGPIWPNSCRMGPRRPKFGRIIRPNLVEYKRIVAAKVSRLRPISAAIARRNQAPPRPGRRITQELGDVLVSAKYGLDASEFRANSADSGPMSAKFDTTSTEFDQSDLGQNLRKSGPCRPIWGDRFRADGIILAEFDHLRPNWWRIDPKSAEIGQIRGEVGANSVQFGPVEIRPTSVSQISPKSDRIRSNSTGFGQHR